MECGLFSYNCRHRLIKYVEGMNIPKQYKYDSELATKKREVDSKIRKYERNIRACKEHQMLSKTPSERKLWQAKSKKLFNEYGRFAKANNRVRNDLRCSTTLNEREALKINHSNYEEDLTKNENSSNVEAEKENSIPARSKITFDYTSMEYKQAIKNNCDRETADKIIESSRLIFSNKKSEVLESLCVFEKGSKVKTLYNPNGKPDEVNYTDEMDTLIRSRDCFIIHNHRGNNPPSDGDLIASYKKNSYDSREHEYLVLTNDGKIYYYTAPSTYISNRVYNDYVSKNDGDVEKAMFDLAKNHGFKFERWK